MTFLDLILGLLLFGFMLGGLWFGLIHMIGAVVGLVASTLVAGHYASLPVTFLGSSNLARVGVFFIIMVLVNRVIGIIFWVIEKAFKIVAVIPFMKTFEKILGGVLGLAEGVVVFGGVLYLAARYPLSDTFSKALATSKLALWLIKAFGIFAPLLPAIIRNLKSIV